MSSSPGRAPRRSKSHQQKSAGFAPVTLAGSVRRARATLTSASNRRVSPALRDGSCLPPANKRRAPSSSEASHCACAEPLETTPRRVPRGPARRTSRGSAAGRAPTSRAPTRRSHAGAREDHRDRPRRRNPDARSSTAATCPDRAGRRRRTAGAVARGHVRHIRAGSGARPGGNSACRSGYRGACPRGSHRRTTHMVYPSCEARARRMSRGFQAVIALAIR